MTEHRDPWPADKKPVDKGIWQGYGPLDTDAEIRPHFIEKFGYPPKEIKRDGGCVRAGPLWQWSHYEDGSEMDGGILAGPIREGE